MELFSLNSKIELITESDRVASGLIYDSSPDKLYVSIFNYDKGFMIFHEEEVLHAIVYLKGQILGFDCKVSGRIYGDIPIYELSNLENFTKIQRRGDVRVPYTHPIRYTGNKSVLKLLDNRKVDDQIWSDISEYLKEGMILDISGGGIKLSCNEDFPLQNILYMELPLNNEKILIKGAIVHKEINTLAPKTRYLYGIKFLNLRERIKDRIIQFVFIQMRKNRTKI